MIDSKTKKPGTDAENKADAPKADKTKAADPKKAKAPEAKPDPKGPGFVVCARAGCALHGGGLRPPRERRRRHQVTEGQVHGRAH